METELFSKLISAIITLLCVIVSGYVIPYMQQKIGQEKLEKFCYYVTVAVRCAEQIYAPEDWRKKKAYVFDYAKKVAKDKLGIDLNDDDIDIIIEGIVNEVKKG